MSKVKDTVIKEKTTGIVLIAIGDYLYTNYAVNACIGLKSHTDNLKVSLITNKRSLLYLEEDEKPLFDSIIICEDRQYNGVRGMDYFKLKLHLDELSPYDKTLYIDADTIWNNDHSIHEFIKSFEGISFTCANRGRIKIEDSELRSRWTDLNKIKRFYLVDELYDLSSEVIYFEKGTKVFSESRKVYNDIRIEPNRFGEGYPDEVFLMIAIEVLKITLHQSPFYPTYWEPHYFYDKVKSKPESEIRQFKILSIGGAFIATKIKRLYINMTGAAYYRMGISKQPYPPVNKSGIVKDRRYI